MHRLAHVTIVALCSPLLLAQREQARLVLGKSECVIDYGTPSWGKHSLDDLPVGGTWRLGSNEATEWRTQAPIVQGTTLLAPGAYRVALRRRADQEFVIEFTDADLALGGERDAHLSCSPAPDKPARKMTIDLGKATGKADAGDTRQTAAPEPGLPARLRVNFGPHRVDADFTMVAGQEVATSPRYRLVGWSLPSKLVDERFARGVGVPIATFVPAQKPRHQDPALFNVVLTKDGVELVPGLLMPEGSFGFAKIAPPQAEWRQAGSIEWGELAREAAHLELSGKLDRKQKRYVLELRCGTRSAVVRVPEPAAKG